MELYSSNTKSKNLVTFTNILHLIHFSCSSASLPWLMVPNFCWNESCLCNHITCPCKEDQNENQKTKLETLWWKFCDIKKKGHLKSSSPSNEKRSEPEFLVFEKLLRFKICHIKTLTLDLAVFGGFSFLLSCSDRPEFFWIIKAAPTIP